MLVGAPARRRAGPRLPRLPADRRPPAARRPDPGRRPACTPPTTSTPFDPGVPFRDTAVEGFENAAAARAFASLPERWQTVLWHTEVEGQKPAEVAPLLGHERQLRVRAGLPGPRGPAAGVPRPCTCRMPTDDACRWTHQNLGAYVRNGISRRDAAKVESHLDECRRCTAIYLELTEVNSNLSGILAPLLLGGAAAAYVGATAGRGRQGRRPAARGPGPRPARGSSACLCCGGHHHGGGRRGRRLRRCRRPGSLGSGRGSAAAGGGSRRRSSPAIRHPSSAPGSQQSGSETVAASVVAPPGPFTSASADPPLDESPSRFPIAAGRRGRAREPDRGAARSTVGRADLRVSGRATTGPALAHRVVVTVSGLAPRGAATLSVTGRGLALVVTLDGRCAPLRSEPSSCRVTTAPTTFAFTAVAAPATASALVFTVTATPARPTRDRANNRTTVPLGS